MLLPTFPVKMYSNSLCFMCSHPPSRILFITDIFSPSSRTIWQSILMNFFLYFFSFIVGPFLLVRCRCRILLLHLITLNHTHTQAICRTPLDRGSVRRRDFYLTTHNIHDRHPHPGGILTHNSSKRETAGLRLRQRGHRDRPLNSRMAVIQFTFAVRITKSFS
jgi:hypothetical protein